LKRVYHPYWLWEEYHAGMWKKAHAKEEAGLLQTAIEFTGNAELYGRSMIEAVHLWPWSCEHNLTCKSMNRQAWIGHAACCIAIACPEYITRLAWHTLSQKQQDDANSKADTAIEYWEHHYERGLRCRKSILELTSTQRQKIESLGPLTISPEFRSAIAEGRIVQLCFTW